MKLCWQQPNLSQNKMQYCSEETIAWLFYNASNSLQLLFIFFYFTSIFLTKILSLFGGNLFFTRNNEGYEYGTFSDEELEDENNKDYNVEESMHEDQHVRTTFCESEKLDISNAQVTDREEEEEEDEEEEEEISTAGNDDDEDVEECNYNTNSENNTYNTSSAFESIQTSDEEVIKEEILARDPDSYNDCDRNNDFGIPTTTKIYNRNKNHIPMGNGICEDGRLIEKEKKVGTFTREDNFVVFEPTTYNLEKKKMEMKQKEDEEDIFGDSCTVGSTSKSSSELRSSINNRDYATDDPFSSSSRRSCPKWESYTVFQKYDEEMLFLDRITAQKLQETESLRSIQACPRSISEKIVHKFVNPKRSSSFHQNPYQELEGAYVAQICLTWEALNWNYKYFQTLRGARREVQDSGCPAYVAQQFQQFLVLLQRYVENEPYEHGRRPEIYARMRRLAPKLLQVPEYRDSDEEKREEGYISSRIPSKSFVVIMEEAIKTFMDFLKADRKSGCQILADFFKRKQRLSVDHTLLVLLNKVNKKKRKKLKELKRSNCMRRRKLKIGEEIEILMGLIDLKVISRVLRMKGLNEEQMHWCEAKLSKVKVSNGKLHRDSSPLFFPVH